MKGREVQRKNFQSQKEKKIKINEAQPFYMLRRRANREGTLEVTKRGNFAAQALAGEG